MKYLFSFILLVFSLNGLACSQLKQSIEGNNGVILHYQLPKKSMSVGSFFSMDFDICKDSKSLPIQDLKINAMMPAHGHGMNYKTEITHLSNYQFKLKNLNFHMPGLWQITLKVITSSSSELFKINISL